MQDTQPQSLTEAVLHFSDPDVCHKHMVGIKWPDGNIVCPECGGEKVGEIKSRRMFQCKTTECRKQFSTKVGTIFEDSALSLSKWFVVIWLIANCKNGASSCELSRAILVTQKSAWHMLHRIRLAMQTGSFRKPLKGVFKSDETFIGGVAKNMHKDKKAKKIKGTGGTGKAIVHGVLKRSDGDHPSEVRLAVVLNQKRATLHRTIKRNVKKGSVVYTDKLASYKGLDTDYIHDVIDHAVRYVEGLVHTNGMENFWSLLKRILRGTYVSVGPQHLMRYCDEEAFRFNERKGNDADRFGEVMNGVVGKRLTYSQLVSETA